jgi:hypothetical protein
MADLKQTFILRCLSQYMADVQAAMHVTASRMKIGVTNDAINSIAYKVAAQSAGAVASLSFKEYLRMVDMGVGRGHPLGGLKSMKLTLQASKAEGYSQVHKNRQSKKIYSKIAYGKITWLQNKLLYGYTEETIAMLKSEIKN